MFLVHSWCSKPGPLSRLVPESLSGEILKLLLQSRRHWVPSHPAPLPLDAQGARDLLQKPQPASWEASACGNVQGLLNWLQLIDSNTATRTCLSPAALGLGKASTEKQICPVVQLTSLPGEAQEVCKDEFLTFPLSRGFWCLSLPSYPVYDICLSASSFSQGFISTHLAGQGALETPF